MAQIDDVKSEVSGLKVDLDSVRQRTESRWDEFSEFKRLNHPVLQDLVGFKQAVLGFNAWAKVLAAIAGSTFLAIATMGVYALLTAGRVDQRVTDLDRRVGGVELRLGKVEERLTEIEVRLGKLELKVDRLETKADKLDAKMDAATASSELNFKAISEALKRIEAAQKKSP